MISVTEQKIEWPTDAEFLWSVSCSGIKMNLELTLGLQFWQGGGPVLGVFPFPGCTQGSESAQHLARVQIYGLIVESKTTRSRSVFS